MNIVEEIGYAASLEQLAEECSELAHAALKLARIMRKDNPTPVGKEEAYAKLSEEANDVILCLEELLTVGMYCESSALREIKRQRWIDRIQESRGDAL
mgnify:CR=1 FL=1